MVDKSIPLCYTILIKGKGLNGMRNWEKYVGVVMAMLAFVMLLCAVIFRPLIWVAFGLMILILIFLFVEQYEEY